MISICRHSAWSFVLMLLTLGCQNGDKNSSTTSSTFSCSVTRDGAVILCTEYAELSGTTLSSIQSECELRGTEGYSWAVAACAPSTIGTCSLPSTAQKPAPGTQYYYGTSFSSGGAASGMCSANDGTFKAAS